MIPITVTSIEEKVFPLINLLFAETNFIALFCRPLVDVPILNRL